MFNELPICIAVKKRIRGSYKLIEANKTYLSLFKDADGEVLRIDRKTDREAVFHGSSSVTIEINNKFYLLNKVFKKDKKMIVVMVTDITNLKKDMYESLRADPLTKAIRREYGLKLLDSAIAKLRDYNIPFSLMAIDLDDFKLVNDRFGHQCGDMVLSATSSVIKQSLRKTDFVIRYGGDEFLVILPFTSRETCNTVAERIRKNIEENKVRCDKGYARITASIGIINVNDRNLKLKDVLEKVDEKLYEAKGKGKNRVEV